MADLPSNQNNDTNDTNDTNNNKPKNGIFKALAARIFSNLRKDLGGGAPPEKTTIAIDPDTLDAISKILNGDNSRTH